MRAALARAVLPVALAAGGLLAASGATAGSAPAARAHTSAVRAPRAEAATAGRSAVESMVVGIGGKVLSAARPVDASAITMRVADRYCAVAARTPLAVLAALRHAIRFAVRDYGHCGAQPSASAQLFVYSLAGERNRGQDGWEYKVNDVSGSTGAADPSGPQGNGTRLRPGQRVLWFWCEATPSGCQPTLSVRASATRVAHGAALAVRAYAHDNEGHATGAGGVHVTLGASSATTDARGAASILAPAQPGRYPLGAEGARVVPAFPQEIDVQ